MCTKSKLNANTDSHKVQVFETEDLEYEIWVEAAETARVYVFPILRECGL